MIATCNVQYAPLSEVRIRGIREPRDSGIREYYEFGLDTSQAGVIRSRNLQFRLDIDPDDARYSSLVKSGHAMDRSKYGNKLLGELRLAAAGAQVGGFVQPVIWAIVPEGTRVEPDFSEIDRRTQEVLDGHRVVDAMRSPLNGKVRVESTGVDNETVIIVDGQQGQPQGFSVPVCSSELLVREEVSFGQPLFAFSPKAGSASRSWIQDKIGRGATEVIAGQTAYDIDLLMSIPSGSFLWFDARRMPRIFSMPARWSSRHLRFEARSPHRAAALKAAGVATVGQEASVAA